MEWLYLDANQQQVTVDESELPGLIQAGTVTAETLLWNEGMSDWQAASSLYPTWFSTPQTSQPASEAPAVQGSHQPKLQGVGPSQKIGMVRRPIHTAHEAGRRGGILERGGGRIVGEERELIRDLASYIGVNAGWMKFLGVMNIINGVLTCLTVVGALFGWIPIWLGVLMFKSANAAVTAQIHGEQEDLEESLDRVSFFFKLQGILMLIWLIFSVLMVISYLVFGLGALIVLQKAAGQEIQMQ